MYITLTLLVSVAVMQADLFRNYYYRGGNIEAMGDGRDGKGSSCSRYWLACRRAADWAASARRFAADARSGSLPPPCHLLLGKGGPYAAFQNASLAAGISTTTTASTIRVLCLCTEQQHQTGPSIRSTRLVVAVRSSGPSTRASVLTALTCTRFPGVEHDAMHDTGCSTE